MEPLLSAREWRESLSSVLVSARLRTRKGMSSTPTGSDGAADLRAARLPAWLSPARSELEHYELEPIESCPGILEERFFLVSLALGD
jgi:hypothetical protein